MDDSIAKYSIKFFTLTAIIVLIFKFMIKKPWFDSILLAMIIVVALICVENIIDVNSTVANPTDCSQCKIKEGFEEVAKTDTPKLDEKQTQQIVENKIKTGVGLDNEYSGYDKSQLKIYNDAQVKDANLFRMSVGNQDLVKQYLQDGKTYYDKLYNESTNGTPSGKLINSELAYGDYNYIGPLNRGMINPESTYIEPSNWFPVPPFSQPCAISANNKSNVNAIINNDGTNNLMNFADLKDFEKTSRMTGSINMNLDYIKRFLNNPETCN